VSNVPFDEKDKRVKLDARIAMVVANEKDVYERAYAHARSTLRGRFAIFARQFFGFAPLSDSAVKEQTRREKLEAIAIATQEEREAQERLNKLLEERQAFNKPWLEREWPDKDTMQTQPVIAAPAEEDLKPQSYDRPEPFVEATRAPVEKKEEPPPVTPVLDTKVNVNVLQGIIFYELPIPTSHGGYDRSDLTDELRDSRSGDLCNLVEKNALFVIYWYGSGSYEGSGDLVVVFDDGSVDTISLGHCSCNGPLDDLSALKRGAYKDIATFRQGLTSEARERDYSTILAFVDGAYELPKVNTPGAQTIQEFPGFAYVTGQPVQAAEALDGTRLGTPAKGWTRTIDRKSVV
jgi:hypothetical protein